MLDAEEGKKDQEEFVATYCCHFEVLSLLAMHCGIFKHSLLCMFIISVRNTHNYVDLLDLYIHVGC